MASEEEDDAPDVAEDPREDGMEEDERDAMVDRDDDAMTSLLGVFLPSLRANWSSIEGLDVELPLIL